MALYAVYRVKNGSHQLEIFFTDMRDKRSVEHQCVLPDHQWLIREISDQLETMGFALEHDEKLDNDKGELRIMAAHATPDGAGDSADAIRTVCTRHSLPVDIHTGVGQELLQYL